MIKFKQKEYTLQEGHYTGPKDQDKVPGAVEVIGKSALGGALAGTVVGAILKDSTAIQGAVEGGKWGTLGGIIFKFFLNYLHNPMTRVKYQEVDKLIRREFGIIRASGITIGDSIKKRATLDEKFSFNDRNVSSYKINFSVQDDEVTMYTLGLSDKELESVNKTLDYYCKKYTGMSYSSSVINQRANSYAAVIVFTNYQVISNFMMELSETLGTKINLLDNKALVLNRITEEEREYSVKEINKFDVIKILGKTCTYPLQVIKNWKDAIGYTIMSGLIAVVEKLSENELSGMDISLPRYMFGNKYLYETLNKLHYIEGFNYTVGRKDINSNISMTNGVFLVTIPKSNKEDVESIDKTFWKPMKLKISRADTGKVIVYTYSLESKNKFEFILKKLMSTGVIFNLFE